MNIQKFRTWDKENKKWTNYQICDDIVLFYEKHTGAWKRDDKREKFELMQSTGLKDKNGKEIFEGDIIEVNVYGEIIIADVKHGEYDYSADDEYECHRYGWYINHVWRGYTDNTGYCLNSMKSRCKVIGNIHQGIIYENPELLKGVQND